MEYTVITKNILIESGGVRIIRIEILAPLIANHARAGQFVVVIAHPKGERIPLTIVECDRTKGTVTLIFQEIGLTTKIFARLNVNDSLFAVVGPLGNATPVKKYGNIILIGGGVGIAEVYPVAKALHDAGNTITVIIGAKTKGMLILENELKSVSDVLYVTTDDGSYARQGFVTSVLSQLLTDEKKHYDLVYAVGPIVMMSKVAEMTKDTSLPTIVSLNTLMVDATGMCGCCRVTVAGKLKFSCVDGPEFDAQKIDWQELSRRNAMYCETEQHMCNLQLPK